MATKDISRSAYYRSKSYTGVRMQQGRVLTDDDYNEGAHIGTEDRRLTRLDVVGSCGSPDNGFAISSPTVVDDAIDFIIEEGSFYLGGHRLELLESETFQLQKNWLRNPGEAAPQGERFDLAYLEVWQQSVSGVEDEELIEAALGGPDTSVRERRCARVVVKTDVGTSDCDSAWQALVNGWQLSEYGVLNAQHELETDATLKVEFHSTGNPQDLCSPNAEGGYLGAENQAIRVQLVDKDHFTWGIDNAAPLYRVQVSLDPNTNTRTFITMSNEPKDEAHWPLSGQVVEILPWAAVLPNGEKLAEEFGPGHFSRVSGSYNPDTHTFTIDTELPNNFGEEWKNRADAAQLSTSHFGKEQQPEYIYLRIWDRDTDRASDPLIPIDPTPVTLGNTGLMISISGNHRCPGNYWIVTERPNTSNTVVPWELEVGRKPEGIQRFYAPLALIHWKSGGAADIRDCRSYFPALTKITANDVAFTNTQCNQSGVLTNAENVQQAIDALCKQINRCSTFIITPDSDIQAIMNAIELHKSVALCFQTGEYQFKSPLVFKNQEYVHISGAGEGTRIVGHQVETLFHFVGCKSVTVVSLYGQTGKADSYKIERKYLNGVLTFSACARVTVENVSLKCGASGECAASCITVRDAVIYDREDKNNTNKVVPSVQAVKSAHVTNCKLEVGHEQIGILFVNVNRSVVENNEIAVTARPGHLTFESLMANLHYRSKIRHIMIQSPMQGYPKEGDDIFLDKQTIGFGKKDKAYVWFRTPLELVDVWPKWIEDHWPQGVQNHRDLLFHLYHVADQVLLNDGFLEDKKFTGFRKWFKMFKEDHPSVSSQGIVVAGTVATDVKIQNNKLWGVAQGIHVGVSHRWVSRFKQPFQAERICIKDNSLGIFAPMGVQAGYGVFIGNVDSLVVQDNYVRVQRPTVAISKVIGIKVHGHLGPMLNVRQNYMKNVDVAGKITSIDKPPEPRVWSVDDNLPSITIQSPQ